MSDNRWETFLGQAPFAFCILSSDFRLVWANPELAKYTGLSLDKIIGKKFEKLFQPVSSEITLKFKDAMDTGQPVFTEISIRLPGEKVHWLNFLLSYYPIKTEAGNISFVAALIQEITSRSVQEFQFLHEKRLTEDAIGNLPRQFFIVNQSGQFVRWDKQFAELIGYRNSQISKLNIADLFTETNKRKFMQWFDRLFKEHSGYLECEILCQGNRRLSIILSGIVQEMNGELCFLGLGLESVNRKVEKEKVLLLSLDHMKQTKNRLEMENEYLKEELALRNHYHEIIGQSRTIKRVLRQVEQVANTDTTVLLLGETGTGKELFARAIHNLSRRRQHAMVEINCAAFPANLIENELFGHEKGAFTGAVSRQTGRFEVANGSTLFLDEINELPLDLQAKLLRVLQEGKFERLGSWNTVAVDVRIIAASNKDLHKAVNEKLFREDLFYRLNVFPITIPSLRNRREDIPLLVKAFVEEFFASMGKPVPIVPDSILRALQQYPWRGNVRELRNIIERAAILTEGSVLRLDLPIPDPLENTENMTLAELEKRYIRHILKRANGRIRGVGGAAEILGLKPSTLESRMKKLGITRSEIV